jgi:hypothetical protein
MSFFSKESPEVSDAKGYVAYEEIDAKRTSTLGYFFLVLMVLFGVWQGNNFLSALQDSISVPQANSRCYSLLSQYNLSDTNLPYYSYNYDGTSYYDSDTLVAPEACVWSARESIAGAPLLYKDIYLDLVSKQSLSKDLSSLQAQISDLKYNRTSTLNDYSMSLLESIAKKNGILNSESLQSSIKTQDDLLSKLNSTADDLTAKLSQVTVRVQNQVLNKKGMFKSIADSYVHDMNVYELERFVLSLLFVVPLFYFVWKKYNKLKNARSEYTVIWGGMVAIVGLILAQVMLVFVYEILPKELLQKIFAFFAGFAFFFTILYYLAFILVPLFFGGLIYLIQKKYYNKKAVTARAFKANKCPTCSMSVAPHMIFCPTCGTTLKDKCASCGSFSPTSGVFCEVCGVKKQTV